MTRISRILMVLVGFLFAGVVFADDGNSNPIQIALMKPGKLSVMLKTEVSVPTGVNGVQKEALLRQRGEISAYILFDLTVKRGYDIVSLDDISKDQSSVVTIIVK